MFSPVVWCLICISFWYFAAVEKALLYLDRDELPPHWDRDLLFGMDESSGNSDSDGGFDSDVRKFYTLVTDWLLCGVYQINPKCVSFLLVKSCQSKVCFQVLFFLVWPAVLPNEVYPLTKWLLYVPPALMPRTMFVTHESIYVFYMILGGKKTASNSPNCIKQLIFVIQMHCVVCEVRTVSK